jgi:hypothetical protein
MRIGQVACTGVKVCPKAFGCEAGFRRYLAREIGSAVWPVGTSTC